MRLCSFAVATPLGPLRRIGMATPQGILDATAARTALLERRLPAAAAQRIAAAEVPPDMLERFHADWNREVFRNGPAV
jgi:hypothetical protein